MPKEIESEVMRRDRVMFWVSLASFVFMLATIVYQAGGLSTRLDVVERDVNRLSEHDEEVRKDVTSLKVDSARAKDTDQRILQTLKEIRKDLKAVYHRPEKGK